MPKKPNSHGNMQEYDAKSGRYGFTNFGEQNKTEEHINTQLFATKHQPQNNSEQQEDVNIPIAQKSERPESKSHKRHAKDMGLNLRQYIREAIRFFNETNAEVYHSQKRNRYYKFDELTNRICICDNNGNIRTFYPTDKEEFDALIKKENLERIWKKK